MIIGKDSIWKMLALFALVLVAVLDLIFCAQNKVVMWINGAIVVIEIGCIIWKLWKKWDDKDDPEKQESK